MAAFRFELVSPEKLLFSGDAESVVVPSAEGEFTMLKDHSPLMASLRPGVVTVTDAAGAKSQLFVRGGFAEVSSRGLTILAEESIPLAELDAAALDRKIKDAGEDLADAKDDAAKLAASEKLAQLNELRAALKL